MATLYLICGHLKTLVSLLQVDSYISHTAIKVGVNLKKILPLSFK